MKILFLQMMQALSEVLSEADAEGSPESTKNQKTIADILEDIPLSALPVGIDDETGLPLLINLQEQSYPTILISDSAEDNHTFLRGVAAAAAHSLIGQPKIKFSVISYSPDEFADVANSPACYGIFHAASDTAGDFGHMAASLVASDGRSKHILLIEDFHKYMNGANFEQRLSMRYALKKQNSRLYVVATTVVSDMLDRFSYYRGEAFTSILFGQFSRVGESAAILSEIFDVSAIPVLNPGKFAYYRDGRAKIFSAIG